MSTPNKGQSSAPVTDKEATPIDGPDPEKFGPVSRFFINYVRPDRDLQIGTAKPEKDNLRQVEKDYYVLTKARQRAHYICAPSIIEFDQCAERDGAWKNWITCRGVMKEMTKCLMLNAADEQIIEQSKQQYLKERSYFRETGKCLSDDPKTERKLKYWIDLGKRDYLAAKEKCERDNLKFDWLRDHCKYTKGFSIPE